MLQSSNESRSELESVDFWNVVQRKMGHKIPKYLVNILTLQGFDNALSLKKFDEDDIILVESYVKTDKFSRRIPVDSSLEDYFGIFHNSKADFEIIPGHKKLLMQVIDYIKYNLNNRGPKFFEMRCDILFYSVCPNVSPEECLKINEEIYVGDRCLFNLNSKILIGLVLSFNYLNGSTYRAREYSRNFATVSSSTDERPIGVLYGWYSYNITGELCEVPEVFYCYNNIKNYRATILAPILKNGRIILNKNTIDKINQFNLI